jgi:hypothetical protein
MAQDEKTPLRELPRQGTPKVKWDTASMKSSYANVCNVASTREEVIVMFGLSQAWSGSEEEVAVQLNERVILSPYAAKRLALLLNNVVQQYESRFGSLETVQPTAPAPSAANN